MLPLEVLAMEQRRRRRLEVSYSEAGPHQAVLQVKAIPLGAWLSLDRLASPD